MKADEGQAVYLRVTRGPENRFRVQVRISRSKSGYQDSVAKMASLR